MNINEKASYIKGLAEGMKFDTTTDTGRLIKEMIGLLVDVCGDCRRGGRGADHRRRLPAARQGEAKSPACLQRQL